MATSLGIILILGLIANTLVSKLHLPGLLGMLLVGTFIGPYSLGILSHETVAELADFRKIALIIILLRAGLGLKKEELIKVGPAAIKMSAIPGILEGFAIAAIASVVLKFSFIEGCVLGFIIAAVSPAVVVPQMLALVEQRKGGRLPTLILAGASADDVVAITLFTAFLGIAIGTGGSVASAAVTIPLSIISGIASGIAIGLAMVSIFSKWSFRDTNKVIILLGTSFLMIAFQEWIKPKFEIAMLLGVMTIGIILLEKIPQKANRIAKKLNKVWLGAEIILFVLVGAQVDPTVALKAGSAGIAILAVGLLARSIGVLISLSKENFTPKEQLFAVVSYLPKATVQAAIGAVPLEMGLASGNTILAIAVLSIAITAPIGAIGITRLAPICLEPSKS